MADELVTGKAVIIGEIDVREPDGEIFKHRLAMLIEFASVEDAQRAMKDGRIAFRGPWE